jgi:hypothetical protein
MHTKQIPTYGSTTLAVTIAIALLYIASSMVPSTHAASPWVEVHPPVIPEMAWGMESIHFMDANTGWAEAPGYEIYADGDTGGREQNVLLRTSDGGQSWQQVEPPDDTHDFPIHFSSASLGSRILAPDHWKEAPNLIDDIEYYQGADGGLMWQLRRGKVTDLVRIGDEVPEGPLEENHRIYDLQAYFVDNQHGWFLAVSGDWRRRWNEFGFRIGKPLAGNVLCSTRDGGESWKCQVHVYLSFLVPHNSVRLTRRAPRFIEFLDPHVGWIVAASGWIYHTVDGGVNWELVDNPVSDRQLHGDPAITDIDFVDESRGWVVTYGAGVYFTDDAGRTWERKLSGRFWAVHADDNGVWVGGRGWSPTKFKETHEGIFYSADNGETWQLEWEGAYSVHDFDDWHWESESSNWPAYIGYHEVTQSLWAGGADGFILKRNLPATAVTPIDKLPALWGKFKAPPSVNR